LTDEKSWVLDPFAGVGSTVIAAVKNNRNAMGIEKENEYCKISNQRIKDLNEGKLKIRPINKPIHKPTGNDKVSQLYSPMELNKTFNEKFNVLGWNESRYRYYITTDQKVFILVHTL
jgi:16S rRNA G966 N2-methylase RsmD